MTLAPGKPIGYQCGEHISVRDGENVSFFFTVHLLNTQR